jgi:NadR type nicotinamide-nucleotide adenylyltransferase
MPNELPKIVVITGAESTGKSVLTRQLASYFDAPFYGEYAREYILNLGRKYEYGDLEIIARKQMEEYSEALQSNSPVVFFDTWLIITKVWFEVVYGQAPSWVSDFISDANISGFMVCDTDLPWEPDEVRENGGEMRNVLQQLYIENLDRFGFRYFMIQGTGFHRFENAKKAVIKILYTH